MSEFPRIDPRHPLTEAARYVNAYSDERGFPATVEWLEFGVSVGELSYLAEQRALRAVAATMGLSLGIDPQRDEQIAQQILASALWQQMKPLLIACYLDGIAIGWKGQELHADEPES